MEYLNKINNEFDILGIDTCILENNKELKRHGLGQKRRKKAHFDAKRIPVINKCKYKLERIICIQGTYMPFLLLEAK